MLPNITYTIIIESLDHVALNVKDLEVSIAWYQKVLGLKKYKLEKWGEFLVFLLEGFNLLTAKIGLNEFECKYGVLNLEKCRIKDLRSSKYFK